MIVTREFDELPLFRYRAILADPPWAFENWSEKGEGKNPNQHYDCMSLKQIAALPVSHLAAPDCLLIMWATWPMLDQQLDVMRRWSFRYVSGGAWAKQSKTGDKRAFGTGYLLRSACEPFLIGTIGKPERLDRSIRNLIDAPVREHSRKPDELYEIIVRLTPGPRLELFARQSRPGWDSWGNEVDKFDGAAA